MTTGINLLPPDLQRQSIRRRVFRQWGGIAILLVSAVSGVALLHWKGCQRLNAEVVAQEKATESVRQTLAGIKQAEARIASLTSEIAGLSGIRVSVDPLSVIACVREAMHACRDEVRVTSITITNTDSANEPAAATDGAVLTAIHTELDQLPTREALHVAIRGEAASDLTIARITGALRDRGVFHSVTLVSTENLAEQARLTRSFEFHCVRRESAR